MRLAAAALRGLPLAAGLLCAGAAAAPSADETSRPTATAAAASTCPADPLQGRMLYLRGTMNSWNAVDGQHFAWACDRWELVTRLDGEHRFKIADEGWSADADFGWPPTAPGTLPATGLSADRPLALRGAEIPYRFTPGLYRLSFSMAREQPRLRIESCTDADQPPFGNSVLYMRGTHNNWAALDDFALQYSCDAYYLNVRLQGAFEFKLADAAWQPASTIGSGPDGRGNFAHRFDGEHTLRLVMAGGRPQLSIGPRSFADPRAAAVTDPVALSLHFDSRQAAHKSPFGAVPAGSTVHYSLTAATGVDAIDLVVERRRLEGNQELLAYTELARVPLVASAPSEGRQRWTASHRYAEPAVYGWWFEARIGGQRFVYQNNSTPIHWTREKGSGGLGAVAELPASPQGLGSIRRFRQTVYAPDFQVPDWAADIVYYYIFPERFRNGDPANDPQPGRDRYRAYTVEKHPRWLSRPYKPGSGDGSDEHYNNDFFGGDLAGIIEKLDYIRDLGANTLYLTPLFRAASNHKYDTGDYRQIDPAFGSNADFERLTREADRRGLRVIVDASLNHTGSDSIYFNRYGNYPSGGAFDGGRIRPDSPYASWYRFDPSQTDPDRQYTGWVGVTDLPELDKSSPGWRAYAYGAPDSVMKLWLDRGAAGWRMDVVPWVSDDFWREWRAAIRAHRPDALTVAETWFDASKYFLGDMFDSTMNYIFRNAVQAYAAGGSAVDLARQLEHLREAYPPQAFQALMNLLSTHDQARALHHFGWTDDTTDPAIIARAKQRLRLAVFFQMTYPGAPTVYYGDEVGLTGGDDPYNRAPYPWADQGGQPDTALLADFKRLIALRHAHPVLRRGQLAAPLLADDQVLVLLRRLGDTWAVTATNNGPSPRRVRLALPAEAPRSGWVDALAATGSGKASPAPQPAGDVLEMEIPAGFGVMFVTAPAARP